MTNGLPSSTLLIQGKKLRNTFERKPLFLGDMNQIFLQRGIDGGKREYYGEKISGTFEKSWFLAPNVKSDPPQFWPKFTSKPIFGGFQTGKRKFTLQVNNRDVVAV